MKLKIGYILLFLLCGLTGCTSMPYVRSDVFLDNEAVRSIYVLPIAPEITLDSKFDISREELRSQLNLALEQIKKIIYDEFSKRGYSIAGYSKNFNELDKNNAEDNLIREVVFEFLEPASKPNQQNIESQIIGEIFTQILASGKITAKDEEDGEKTVKQEKKQNQQPEEKVDPLVKKVLAAKKLIPEGIDTVLLVKIESFIAPRGWWKKLTEESRVSIFMTMVSLPEQKIIFSYIHSQGKSDILDAKSLESAIEAVLERIPVKL